MRGFEQWLGALVVCLSTAGANAQRPLEKAIVRVRDTAGVAIGGAQVSIVQGLNASRASGVSDDRGIAALSVSALAADADAELVVRKIGYTRADRFFRATRDSMLFDVVLRRSTQELAPVVVTATENIKRRAYHIGADDIANSTATLIDATDILAKLRPDMICGRSCRPMASTIAKVQAPVRRCPTLAFQQPPRVVCPPDDTPPSLATNIWINGRRLRLVAPNEMALARQHGLLAGLSPGAMTVLSEIKPEHIDEMTYVDSMDNSMGAFKGAGDGLFIVLKPGVAYEPGKPSYVVAEDTTRTATAVAGSSSLPAYRYRLLGVFDDETGDPIEGADVADVNTGTRARTTATGTVSLVFLPEGGTPVRITKPGYEDLTIGVEISEDQREPLTLLMKRAAGKPPAR